jgi:putative ABC transport system permease protein
LHLDEGRFIADGDVLQRNLVCVLGAEVARALGKHGHVGQTVRIENLEYHVVGVLGTKSWISGKNSALTTRNLNKTIFIPLGTESALPKQITNKNDGLTEIILQIDHRKQSVEALPVLKRILEINHGGIEDYQIVIPQELLHQADRTQQTFNLVLGSIAAISLLVGGIGIMNIMLATVSERTREIGIRRAVGANKTHIVVQFLMETLLLTLSGAILGIVVGICFSVLISAFAGWNTIVKPWSILLSLSMATGVGLFSGLYPAFKAAAMNPIKALRHD